MVISCLLCSRDSNSRQSESRPVEVVEELQSLGCPEIADPNQVFEPTGMLLWYKAKNDALEKFLF